MKSVFYLGYCVIERRLIGCPLEIGVACPITAYDVSDIVTKKIVSSLESFPPSESICRDYVEPLSNPSPICGMRFSREIAQLELSDQSIVSSHTRLLSSQITDFT